MSLRLFLSGPVSGPAPFRADVPGDGDDVIVCGDTMRQPAFVVVCRDGEVVQLSFYVLRFLVFPSLISLPIFNQGGIATAAYLSINSFRSISFTLLKPCK